MTSTQTSEMLAAFIVLDVPLDDLTPDPENRPAGDVKDLAASIKELGVLEPILVARGATGEDGQPVENDETLWIVAGERRWRAAKEAGLKTVPALVREGMTARQRIEAQFTENNQRSNLSPMEEAVQLARLVAVDVNVKGISKIVGRTTKWVEGRLDLLVIPERYRRVAAKMNTADRESIVFMAKNNMGDRIAETFYDDDPATDPHGDNLDWDPDHDWVESVDGLKQAAERDQLIKDRVKALLDAGYRVMGHTEGAPEQIHHGKHETYRSMAQAVDPNGHAPKRWTGDGDFPTEGAFKKLPHAFCDVSIGWDHSGGNPVQAVRETWWTQDPKQFGYDRKAKSQGEIDRAAKAKKRKTSQETRSGKMLDAAMVATSAECDELLLAELANSDWTHSGQIRKHFGIDGKGGTGLTEHFEGLKGIKRKRAITAALLIEGSYAESEHWKPESTKRATAWMSSRRKKKPAPKKTSAKTKTS